MPYSLSFVCCYALFCNDIFCTSLTILYAAAVNLPRGASHPTSLLSLSLSHQFHLFLPLLSEGKSGGGRDGREDEAATGTAAGTAAAGAADDAVATAAASAGGGTSAGAAGAAAFAFRPTATAAVGPLLYTFCAAASISLKNVGGPQETTLLTIAGGANLIPGST